MTGTEVRSWGKEFQLAKPRGEPPAPLTPHALRRSGKLPPRINTQYRWKHKSRTAATLQELRVYKHPGLEALLKDPQAERHSWILVEPQVSRCFYHSGAGKGPQSLFQLLENSALSTNVSAL